MVVEEFHDQKIIYHLNIDEEVNNILMHLSSLKTIKTNITWLYGKGLCICIGLILLLALPKIVRKRG